MLKSLFGELGSRREPGSDDAANKSGRGGFAATALMETQSTEVTPAGRMVDRYSQELVVVGSPAQAIRKHFASTRADLESASRMITLLDPSNAWASWVIKALSDAGGLPVERLHLREATTLRTLATVERTTLMRRHDDSLKITFADVRAPGRENAEIPVALMERSQLTTVIVGTLRSHAVDALLTSLHEAITSPTWRCPNVLFLLPPDADWIIEKITSATWASKVRISHRSEALLSASAVWNTILEHWGEIRSLATAVPSHPEMLGLDDFPIKVVDLTSTDDGDADSSFSLLQPFELTKSPAPSSPVTNLSEESPVQVKSQTPHAGIDVVRIRYALLSMRPVEGLLACAVVDVTNNKVLAYESPAGLSLDMDQAAAHATRLLRSHRQAATGLGLSPNIHEVTARAGSRQVIFRPITRQPRLFLWVLLDRSPGLADDLARQLSETEKLLQ